MITLAACAGLAGAAQASDCAFTPAPATRLQSMAAVADYKAVLKTCVAADGRKAVAIREMTVAGQKVALLADPEALTTRLERAACWTCHDESEDELNATRMGHAIRESAEAPGLIHRGFLQNAGLTHGGGHGDFVTGDLCPSHKPLDRAFFTRLEATSPHAPVALSISAGSSVSAIPARSTYSGPITPITTPIVASCLTMRTSCSRRASIRRKRS